MNKATAIVFIVALVAALGLPGGVQAQDGSDCRTCCMNWDGTTNCSDEPGLGVCCQPVQRVQYYQCFPSRCDDDDGARTMSKGSETFEALVGGVSHLISADRQRSSVQ